MDYKNLRTDLDSLSESVKALRNTVASVLGKAAYNEKSSQTVFSIYRDNVKEKGTDEAATQSFVWAMSNHGFRESESRAMIMENPEILSIIKTQLAGK